jgi:fatty-acyl-CoA synthase
MEMTAGLTADPSRVLADLIDDQGARLAERLALVGDRGSLTYAELAARCRRYARWALAQGLGRGRSVALLAPSSPDYFAFWAGVSRTGASVSLINANLRGAVLAHSVGVTAPACLVVDPSLAEAVVGLDSPARVWRLGTDLDPDAYADDALPRGSFDAAVQSDTALHIFTSGTTGLPKAARISHARILSWIGWFAGLMGAGPEDRLYDCLPMHHSVGGVTAVGAMIAAGGSVAIAEGFSVSRFWSDVRRFDCTIAQYIGELCRYLLTAPPSPDDARHGLRLICGNGLSERTWTAFQARFQVPAILEFYAATEGVFSLYNVEGRPGAIGRVPPFLAHRFPAAIVRFDPQAEAPARGADGRCIACAADEVGEAIGKAAGEAGAGAFEGYTDAKASSQKLLRDVFAPGDAWFRTGDLMRKDPAGFFHFVDRIGDTFRWKGENVSTGEVANVVAAAPGVDQAVVYGVQLPHAEGRAGMAAILPSGDFDPAALAVHLGGHLPSYARPLFLRLLQRMPVTETLKIKKQALAEDGFAAADYWLDPATRTYVPLDAEAIARVRAGEARL